GSPLEFICISLVTRGIVLVRIAIVPPRLGISSGVSLHIETNHVDRRAAKCGGKHERPIAAIPSVPQAVFDRAYATLDYARHNPHIILKMRIGIDKHHDFESSVIAEARSVLVPIVEAIITTRDDVCPGTDLIGAVHCDDPASDSRRTIK